MRLLKIAAAALALAPLSALAAQDATPAATGYVVPETETWELKGADGYPYQIFVSKPAGEAPEGGYPVLYVLDANAYFAGFAETRRLLSAMKSDLGKSIVVGIGYKTADPYDARRVIDFVQDYQKPPMPAQVPLMKNKAGGHEAFARYILETLRPELNRRYKTARHRESLFGHSFGGLFALHMLYNHPTEFRTITSASPSIWWNDQSILKDERAFAAKLMKGEIKGPVAYIRLITGDLDEMPVEHTDAVALAKRLEPLSAYGLRSESEIFKGETHIMVPGRSINSTLRFAFVSP